MAEKQTPTNPEQDFSAEEFRRLLGLGLAIGKNKLMTLAGKIRERVEQEFNPTAKLEKSLKAQYEDLVTKGVDPKVAEKVVMETAREMVQKFQNVKEDAEVPGTESEK